MPEVYNRWLSPTVFRPFAVDLARRAALLEPSRVLEIAAGTGALTMELAAAIPAAEITATDLNAAMVEYGAARAPGAKWQRADAMDLAFEESEFDLVICQFGVMFFPDKPAAFSQIRRVLAPAGRFVFNAWDTVDTHGFESVLTEALGVAFPDDPPTFIVTTPHGYADVRRAQADLAAGGLECMSTQRVTVTGHAASIADLATGYCTGTPLRMEIQSRGDVAASTEIIGREMTERLGPGPVTAEMTAYVIEARPLT